MGIRGKHFTISELVCTKCGRMGIPIGRKQSRQREQGHLKKMYCLFCKEETNHLEKRAFDHLSEEEFLLMLEEVNKSEEGEKPNTQNSIDSNLTNE